MTPNPNKKVICDFCGYVRFCICIDLKWYCPECEHEDNHKRKNI